ncbi:MAG: phospholipase A [Proteobacteria bacterium]|nr:phospholipase A [Pseudomonadota bacterium]
MKKACTGKVLVAAALVCTLWSGLWSPCSASDDTVRDLSNRMVMEQAAEENPFLLLPHRPNYILPFYYSTDPNAEVQGLSEDELDRIEMLFQISLKVLIDNDFLGSKGDLYAAYTSRSWWQAYNGERSSPFRETNHEPEMFLFFDTDFGILGMKAFGVVAGVSHQSNGQGGDLSRSWNRVYLDLLLSRKNMIVNVKPWYRIPEKEKKDPQDPSGDDNPDLMEYMGPGELSFVFAHRNHTFTVLLRNNLRKDNKGAVELGWSYPLSKKIKGYVRFFEGYGESLIDYNHRETRLGFGLLMADWL